MLNNKWVKIEKCDDSIWWYSDCEGMVINVLRKPFISENNNIVYRVIGTNDRNVLVEDVVDTDPIK